MGDETIINVIKNKTIKSVIATCLLVCLSTQVSFPMKNRAKGSLATNALIEAGMATAIGAHMAYNWWKNKQEQQRIEQKQQKKDFIEFVRERLKEEKEQQKLRQERLSQNIN